MNSPIEEVEPMTKEEYEEANVVSMAKLLKHAYPESVSCSEVGGHSESEENDWLTPALRREAERMNSRLFNKRYESNSDTAGKLETDGVDDHSAEEDEVNDGLTPELRRKIEEIEEKERDLTDYARTFLPPRTKESDEEFLKWMNSPIEEVEPKTEEERKEASIVNMAKTLKVAYPESASCSQFDGRSQGEENDWLTPALRREAEQLHKSLYNRY
jgi:hypothetical protein